MSISKEVVLGILKELNYNLSNIEGRYDKYEKDGFPDIYVGNYFIEIETQPHSFPWKDPKSTIKMLHKFLIDAK